jgi:hypothetical protein
MRRFDKVKNIHKANLLNEVRYLESKGLLKESLVESEKIYVNKKNGKTLTQQEVDGWVELAQDSEANNRRFYVNYLSDFGVIVPPKKSDWTTKILPKIKEILSKIDAPIEWKNTIIKCEKLAYSAKKEDNRGVPRQTIYQEFGDKWNDLMKHTGNPQVSVYSNDKTKEIYWNQYCELMGLSNSIGFDDIIA